MAELCIQIEDGLLARLEQRAQSNGRSLDAEVEYLLCSTLPEKGISHESLLEIADKIASMTPKDVKQADSVKILLAHQHGTAIEE